MGAPSSIPEVLITCNACGAELAEGDQALIAHADVCPEIRRHRAGAAALAAPKARAAPSEADRKTAYGEVADLIDARLAISTFALPEVFPDRPGVVEQVLRIRDAMRGASRVPLSPTANDATQPSGPPRRDSHLSSTAPSEAGGGAPSPAGVIPPSAGAVGSSQDEEGQ